MKQMYWHRTFHMVSRESWRLPVLLATEPKLLLLDEPAAGMNPNETGELMETIQFVREHFGYDNTSDRA